MCLAFWRNIHPAHPQIIARLLWVIKGQFFGYTGVRCRTVCARDGNHFAMSVCHNFRLHKYHSASPSSITVYNNVLVGLFCCVHPSSLAVVVVVQHMWHTAM